MRWTAAVWMVFFAAALQASGASSECTPIERSVDRQFRSAQSEDRFRANYCPLVQIIAYAFEMDSPASVIGPDWISEERFNVTCEGPDLRAALREALRREFGLTAERGMRPVKAWVMHRLETARTLPAADFSDPANLKQATSQDWSVKMSGGWSMKEVADLLQHMLKIPVCDETDLGGSYVVSMQFNFKDPQSMIQTFRNELGVELAEEYRDIDALVVLGAIRPDPGLSSGRYSACQPSGEVRKAIQALPPMDRHSLSYEERIVPRRKLAEVFPGDIFAATAVQDAIKTMPHLKRDWDSALASYAALDDPVIASYLEARLLSVLRPRRAEELLRSALSQAPDFPWAKLSLASILLASSDAPDPQRSESYPDTTVQPSMLECGKQTALCESASEAERYLREFRTACPANLDDIELYERLPSSDFLVEARRRFEGVLTSRMDDKAVRAYPSLWRLRKRTWEWAEGGFRLSVRRDLMRLLALDRTASSAWVNTMLQGYELIGDESGAETLRERIVRKEPGTQIAYELIRKKTEESWRAAGKSRQEALTAALPDWRRRWPHLPQLFLESWIVQSAPESGPAEGGTTDTFLEVARRYPDLLLMVPAPLLAAEREARRGAEPARIAALVQDAKKQAEGEEYYRLRSELKAVRGAAQLRLQEVYRRCDRALSFR